MACGDVDLYVRNAPESRVSVILDKIVLEKLGLWREIMVKLPTRATGALRKRGNNADPKRQESKIRPTRQ